MPRYTTVGGYPNPDPYASDVDEEAEDAPVPAAEGDDMSHDLANSMRAMIFEEMRAQQRVPEQMTEYMGEVRAHGDMLVSTAQKMAAALGCHWEARLHQRETAHEAVALVRDAS